MTYKGRSKLPELSWDWGESLALAVDVPEFVSAEEITGVASALVILVPHRGNYESKLRP